MVFSDKLGWGVIASLGAITILVATRWGIGLSPDSIIYIAGARSFLSGSGFRIPSFQGVFEPVKHHAPFYSMFMALVGLLGVEVALTVRWFNAFLLDELVQALQLHPIARASDGLILAP